MLFGFVSKIIIHRMNRFWIQKTSDLQCTKEYTNKNIQ
jgi:hypothetical protein